jgi:hypothetical protein
MIQRRAKAAGITTQVGNHTFRATGVTAYLKNGGRRAHGVGDADVDWLFAGPLGRLFCAEVGRAPRSWTALTGFCTRFKPSVSQRRRWQLTRTTYLSISNAADSCTASASIVSHIADIRLVLRTSCFCPSLSRSRPTQVATKVRHQALEPTPSGSDRR